MTIRCSIGVVVGPAPLARPMAPSITTVATAITITPVCGPGGENLITVSSFLIEWNRVRGLSAANGEETYGGHVTAGSPRRKFSVTCLRGCHQLAVAVVWHTWDGCVRRGRGHLAVSLGEGVCASRSPESRHLPPH